MNYKDKIQRDSNIVPKSNHVIYALGSRYIGGYTDFVNLLYNNYKAKIQIDETEAIGIAEENTREMKEITDHKAALEAANRKEEDQSAKGVITRLLQMMPKQATEVKVMLKELRKISHKTEMAIMNMMGTSRVNRTVPNRNRKTLL